MPKNNIMYLISIFFGVFGLTLVAAIYYSENERGQIVNLICGLIFITASIGSWIIAKKSSKKNN
ncbi:MAG: hypothetical protein A2068_05700 [Ignavibacteria bacterium GWB2_35_6b]|nr:MAG: hypothetical protein A2068_05700 [Ignavibacteria bacterium GWB2_35_6b]